MAAQNSAGIQTLLDREKRRRLFREACPLDEPYSIADNLADTFLAREYRTKRVKDARSEAQKEVEDYRKQKEDEYKQFNEKQSSGNKDAEQQAEKDTEKKLAEIKDIGNKTGQQVVNDLVNAVVEVKPVAPSRTAQPVA
ncbi:hypothetical protein LTR37_001857 [Vermiconidia calcicola]|uniref:Uncharacterized protein n=1 Tax=Vermiconidia calcicola TaxID=1690605 RepID=A0ACC3NU92_9PEZI|nr:hypothetical protein LTR37_001857 [Vermiconidia calcicola]